MDLISDCPKLKHSIELNRIERHIKPSGPTKMGGMECSFEMVGKWAR